METTSTSLKQTLAELVRFNSVSSQPNREIINYLAKRTEARGFSTRIYSYTDERGIEKQNLVATSNDGANEVELALVGHTDVVPFPASWTNALELTERESGKLYARGACDTKGFIAATLTAVDQIEVKDLRRPLALVFTSDEETGCAGAKHLVEAQALRPRYAIVGEPTSLRPVRAGKGYCLGEIVVRGREGHSAHPQVGVSAIMKAWRLLERIEQIGERLKLEPHADFDPPFTTLNVGMIRGGTAKNVIAGECRLTLEWRPVPNQDARHAVDLIEREIEAMRRTDTNFDCELIVERLDDGMETPLDSPLVAALEQATGQSSGTVAFGTEAPQLAEMGAQAVVLGAGSIRVAHTDREFVPIEELERSAAVLREMIKKFC